MNLKAADQRSAVADYVGIKISLRPLWLQKRQRRQASGVSVTNQGPGAKKEEGGTDQMVGKRWSMCKAWNRAPKRG